MAYGIPIHTVGQLYISATPLNNVWVFINSLSVYSLVTYPQSTAQLFIDSL